MKPSPPSFFVELWRLLKPFWPLALFSTVMGMAGGLGVTALLSMINAALGHPAGISDDLLLALCGLCTLTLAAQFISEVGTNRIGQHVIVRLRRELAEKILSAPVDRLERYPHHRLVPILTRDVDDARDLAFVFPRLAISVSVMIGCAVYLALISLPVTIVALAALAAGTVVQYGARRRGLRGFDAAREAEDDLQRSYEAISHGAKEFRMNRARRARILRHDILPVTDRIRRLHIEAVNAFSAGKTLGSALVFIVIILVLAMHTAGLVDSRQATAFAIVLLYMTGPLEQIVGSLPTLGRAQIALARVARLSAEFSNPEPHLILDGARPAPGMPGSIALDGVRYAFRSPDGEESFALGPVDFSLRRGEMLFVVGENGCGKTTLVKLLLGLYAPQQGAIRTDGAPVTERTRDDYRQLFSTVFSDFHLFAELPPADDGPDSAAVARYLERLEIGHKVGERGGRFTTTELSTGQRKRLALVHAFLEDRPVLVFDEWAADQDPTFRRVFYTEILPDLKRRGKTLIVISHDDRYFHVADRCIALKDGLIESEWKPAGKETTA